MTHFCVGIFLTLESLNVQCSPKFCLAEGVLSYTDERSGLCLCALFHEIRSPCVLPWKGPCGARARNMGRYAPHVMQGETVPVWLRNASVATGWQLQRSGWRVTMAPFPLQNGPFDNCDGKQPKLMTLTFTARQRSLYAERFISCGRDVCPSACPSVTSWYCYETSCSQ